MGKETTYPESVRSSGEALLPQYMMNGLSNLDETDRQYLLTLIDNPVKFWRSEVKNRGHSRPSMWRRYPRRCCPSSTASLSHLVFRIATRFYSIYGALSSHFYLLGFRGTFLRFRRPTTTIGLLVGLDKHR